MPGSTPESKFKRYLHLLNFWFLSYLFIACGSAKIAPQHAESSTSFISIDSLIAADPAVESYIQPYKLKLEERLDSIIGYAARELTKAEVESPLGNFVADINREAAQKVSNIPVDMGVVTIGGLRMPIPEGPIRTRDMYEVMPFENLLVVLRLSGPQTRELFEFAAARKIVAISNSKMQVRDGKPVNITIDGKPFDESKSYTVATSDYLAGGGDNMTFFKDAEVVNATDVLLRTAIIDKIKALQQAGQKIDARLEGRIEVIN
ncbi:5'-nucleotidase C-terminal domain-containing protein [Cesiribacter sp. SM1]|uniref:5'-nucleotidase C-terminal domain-containing protein n=1 Tax=Cesiribacter sp. SM1 TaxID=2861196 RepID=UPI001CD47445|nr:5'-nucleotidase [Cesiribacter sp. SM1]